MSTIFTKAELLALPGLCSDWRRIIENDPRDSVTAEEMIAEVNAKNNNPNNLIVWLMSKGTKYAEALIDEGGINVDTFNTRGQTALYLAVMNDDTSVATPLKQRGASDLFPTCKKCNPRKLAYKKGNPAMIAIIEQGG